MNPKPSTSPKFGGTRGASHKKSRTPGWFVTQHVWLSNFCGGLREFGGPKKADSLWEKMFKPPFLLLATSQTLRISPPSRESPKPSIPAPGRLASITPKCTPFSFQIYLLPSPNEGATLASSRSIPSPLPLPKARTLRARASRSFWQTCRNESLAR